MGLKARKDEQVWSSKALGKWFLIFIYKYIEEKCRLLMVKLPQNKGFLSMDFTLVMSFIKKVILSINAKEKTFYWIDLEYPQKRLWFY